MFAIKKQPNIKDQGLILHSDQGAVYTSKKYQQFCQKNNITISMSRKATPYDNAVMESFFSGFKKEVLYNLEIKDMKNYIRLTKK
jgi:transposase InsO family protein